VRQSLGRLPRVRRGDEGALEGAPEEGSDGASDSESESDPEGELISAPYSELDSHSKCYGPGTGPWRGT
jgi:hypothetical protein